MVHDTTHVVQAVGDRGEFGCDVGAIERLATLDIQHGVLGRERGGVQWLIQLVGDPGDDLSQGRQLVQSLDALLNRLEIRDVSHDRLEFAGLSVHAAYDHVGPKDDPLDVRSVGNDAMLDHAHRPAIPAGIEKFGDGRAIARMDVGENFPADDIGAGGRQKIAERLVREDDAPVRPEPHDKIGLRFDDRVVAPLVFLQRPFRTALLGHVVVQYDEPALSQRIAPHLNHRSVGVLIFVPHMRHGSDGSIALIDLGPADRAPLCLVQ